MANLISQVKLPNNTTYTIRDPNARPLSNNDFDTINVTELNAGDLIVTGVGRFTNGLYGDLSGTATQVSNNLKIQLNSGTTEGTNQFTYNGSTAKTVNITKSGIGLGNVENKSSATIRSELTSSNVTTALGYTPLNSTLKGASNGVAELDTNGLVPSSQLPSYVDDVLEYSSKSAFPATGETGKIYVATDTNLTYRWGGSAYTEISPSLALGETSSTAYRGDRGATAYSHATDSSRLTTATASGLYKVASTAQGHIASLTAVTKADITGLGIPGTDTNTHRPIQMNGTEILGNNTTALNLKAGTNVSLSNSSGTVTIASTDTNTTYRLSASGESVVLSGSDNSSSTANLSTAFANYTPYKGNLTSILGSASPASAMKTYWDNNDNIKPTSVNTAYNTAGQEYAFLLSKGNSNQYGAVIRWGYGTKYFEILRKYGSTWKDDDWVKMDAGYADTAGADGDGNTITTTYLPKTTYEWNKEVSFGSSGYLKIGSFAMYDSNVTIEINSTASTTYHGTLVIATQNVTDSSIGSVHVVKVYDDPSGIIANSLRIVWTNGSRNYDIYFVPSNWSKNLVHIQALGLYGYSDICTAQTGTPPTTTTGLEPINVLDSKSAVSGGTDVSMVTTGEKYTWNSYGSGSARDNTKVAKAGDTMSGALTVEASNSYSSYNEGIRINAGARTYATLLMGGTAGTTSGTNDGAFWIGVYNTGGTARRLMIAHNGSTGTGTYFYASSASNVSPSLAIGTDLKVAGISYLGVGNTGITGGISLYSTSSPLNYGIAMRTTTNGGKHGGVQGDWATYFSMNNQDNRGWIFRRDGSMGVASVDTTGNAVFNGYVGIGGNTTNTSGVRQVYNSTTKSLDFVFVA